MITIPETDAQNAARFGIAPIILGDGRKAERVADLDSFWHFPLKMKPEEQSGKLIYRFIVNGNQIFSGRLIHH